MASSMLIGILITFLVIILVLYLVQRLPLFLPQIVDRLSRLFGLTAEELYLLFQIAEPFVEEMIFGVVLPDPRRVHFVAGLLSEVGLLTERLIVLFQRMEKAYLLFRLFDISLGVDKG